VEHRLTRTDLVEAFIRYGTCHGYDVFAEITTVAKALDILCEGLRIDGEYAWGDFDNVHPAAIERCRPGAERIVTEALGWPAAIRAAVAGAPEIEAGH